MTPDRDRGPSGLPRAGSTGPEPLRPSLDRLTRGLGAPPVDVLTTLYERWDDLVGPELAAHAWPLTVLKGTLVVGVDAPGWASHLRFGEADLVSRLAEELGAGQVARIEVRVHPR